MADELAKVEQHTPFPATTVPVDGETASGGMGFWVGGFMAPYASGLPAYWSPARDAWLRDFVVTCDPLKVATATFMNKAVSVPVSVLAKDSTIKRHTDMARELEYNLLYYSGFMRGFKEEFKKFCYDYLTTDNGAFMLVLGNGPANGPIIGKASGIIHLDSLRCQRTGDPLYPVIYMHTDGRRYALHYTRVLMMANLPSPRSELFGIGLSAASCAIESSQELKDIATYSAEKMGSRPPRQILYVKTGATLDQLKGAVNIFESKMASDDFQRFSKTLLLAPRVANQNLELGKVDLAGVPDGFDREKVTILDLSMLAAAYGLDLHDLSVSLGGSGQNRATAEVQSKKGRGKGVHEFLETFVDQMERRFLPDYLSIQFDVIDDDADEQRARSRDIRSQYRERDLRSGVTTVRTERVGMLRSHEITQEDFHALELADGRTPDGLDILFLFHSQDAEIQTWLGGFTNAADPTNLRENERESMIAQINERKVEVYQRIETAPNADVANRAKMALAALQKLQTMYEEMPPPDMELNDRVALEAMDDGTQQQQDMDSVDDMEDDVEEDMDDEDELSPQEEALVKAALSPDDLRPNEGMIAEAKRGLEWRREFRRGGTAVGVARARDIANNRSLSPSTWKRMYSFFSRHEVDKKGQGFSPGEAGYPSAGRIAWALWGGDAGFARSRMMVQRMEAQKQLPFGETARRLAETTDLTVDDARLLDQATAIYEQEFRRLVQQASEGELQPSAFEQVMVDLVSSVLLFLFLSAARQSVSAVTPPTEQAIRAYIRTHTDALQGLSRDIYAGRYSPDRLTLNGLFKRTELWVNMAVGAFEEGKLYRRDNPRYRWVRNLLKDSCTDCLRLDGQVHSAEAWRAANWVPRSTRLACSGYHCGCTFVETNEAETGTF